MVILQSILVFDLGITSSEYNRRRKISDILDSEIRKNARKYGSAQYGQMLGMPVYAIRDNILDFIGKLHNKSVNVAEISAADFGSLSSDDSHTALAKENGQYHIGYSLSIGETGSTIQNLYFDNAVEKAEKSREETRILYVAMTRAIRSFSWIELEGKNALSWQNLINKED